MFGFVYGKSTRAIVRSQGRGFPQVIFIRDRRKRRPNEALRCLAIPRLLIAYTQHFVPLQLAGLVRTTRGSRIECELLNGTLLQRKALQKEKRPVNLLRFYLFRLLNRNWKWQWYKTKDCSRVWKAEQIWLILARDNETVQTFLRSLSPFIAIADSCKMAGLQCYCCVTFQMKPVCKNFHMILFVC